eukprot:g32379.t1
MSLPGAEKSPAEGKRIARAALANGLLKHGKEFPSIKAAGEALGINRGNIRRSSDWGTCSTGRLPFIRDVLLLNLRSDVSRHLCDPALGSCCGGLSVSDFLKGLDKLAISESRDALANGLLGSCCDRRESLVGM